MYYSTRTILNSTRDFLVKLAKIIFDRCRICVLLCVCCFGSRYYFDSLQQEQHLEDTKIEEDMNIEEAPRHDTSLLETTDNSVLMRGGFSIMKEVEGINDESLNILLQNKDKVQEKFKASKKKGTATKMFKKLINETYNEDKKLLEEKQKEIKQKSLRSNGN